MCTCGLVLVTGGAGCAFGPKVLEQSHSRYNASIRHVYEEQLLENIVRCRYNESPFKLSVSSIAAQYELSGGGEARPFFAAPNPAGSTFKTFTSVLPDFIVGAANRPTITLIPSGGDAVRRFLTPITPETLPIWARRAGRFRPILRLYAERLNGVPNAPSASGPQRSIVPEYARFQRIAYLMQVAQDLSLGYISSQDRETEVGPSIAAVSITPAAAVEAAKNSLTYQPTGDGKSWVLTRKEHKLILQLNPAALDHPVVRELASLLNLEPGEQTFEIITSGEVADPKRFPGPPSRELSLTPRSTAQVFFYLANGIEVPAEHLAAGLVSLPLARMEPRSIPGPSRPVYLRFAPARDVNRRRRLMPPSGIADTGITSTTGIRRAR